MRSLATLLRWRPWRGGSILAVALSATNGCTPPAPCVEAGVIDRPLSFGDRGPADLEAWQTKARAAARAALSLDSIEVGRVPVVVREPQREPMVGTAVVLHGHGYSALSVLLLADLGEQLSARGWRVIAPALRGFGRFPQGTRRHRDYVRTLDDDAYLPLVIGDVLATVRAETSDRKGPVVVVGHSLGAHVALHVAALEPNVDGVMLLGLFLRTACINSSEHAPCQHHAPLAALLGAEDLALLVAPRRLSVVWGENDAFYTAAARGLIETTAVRYQRVGAGDRFASVVLPGARHNTVDAPTVVSFFASFEKGGRSRQP